MGFISGIYKDKDQFLLDQALVLTHLFEHDPVKVDYYMNIINNSLQELDKLMGKSPKLPSCKLLIMSNKEIKAKHIHIAVSGFLS